MRSTDRRASVGEILAAAEGDRSAAEQLTEAIEKVTLGELHRGRHGELPKAQAYERVWRAAWDLAGRGFFPGWSRVERAAALSLRTRLPGGTAATLLADAVTHWDDFAEVAFEATRWRAPATPCVRYMAKHAGALVAWWQSSSAHARARKIQMPEDIE